MDREAIKKAIKKAGSMENAGVSKVDMMRAAYDLAVHKFGVEVVGEFEGYLPRPNGYWTLEACKEDALRFDRPVDWQNNSASAYSAARKNGWLEECCKHMTIKKRHTLESCKEDALRFDRPSDWRKNSASAHSAACRKGWLEECCQHMTIKKRHTLESCKEDALRFDRPSDWQNNSASAYSAAHRNGWLDQCCGHMENLHRKPIGYWTLERCLEDALKYKNRYEWQKGSGSAYNKAKENDWLEQCCAHMENGRKNRKPRTTKPKQPQSFESARAV